MRSHLTAIGTGLGIALLAGGLLALLGPRHIHIDEDSDSTILNVASNGKNSFYLKDDETDLEANWRGDFTLAPGGDALTMLEKSLKIISKTSEGEYSAEFGVDGDKITSTYTVDGKRMPAGVEANQGASELLRKFARVSGVGAAERARALLADGGSSAVMDEIEQITVGQSAAAFIEALAKEAALSRSDVERLERKIKSFAGDYAKRRAIVAILGAKEAPTDAVELLLPAAAGVSGDHELRLIIESVAEHKLSGGAFSFANDIINRIDGDHELRLAAEALLSGPALSDTQAAAVLEEIVIKLDDLRERRLLTEAALRRADPSPVLLAAALSAARIVDDSHERRLALEGVAGVLGENQDIWVQTINAGATIEDEYERLKFLEATLDNMPHTDEVRAAWEAVAQGITSEQERVRALDMLAAD